MTETELEALHFSEAPKMVLAACLGPKASEALALSARVESMARGGGRMPVVMGRAAPTTACGMPRGRSRPARPTARATLRSWAG